MEKSLRRTQSSLNEDDFHYLKGKLSFTLRCLETVYSNLRSTIDVYLDRIVILLIRCSMQINIMTKCVSVEKMLYVARNRKVFFSNWRIRNRNSFRCFWGKSCLKAWKYVVGLSRSYSSWLLSLRPNTIFYIEYPIWI